MNYNSKYIIIKHDKICSAEYIEFILKIHSIELIFTFNRVGISFSISFKLI